MATGLYPAADAWFNSPIPDYFPGQTVAGMNQFQQQGYQNQLGALEGVANQAGGLFDFFNQYVRGPQTVNPYLDELVTNYQDSMQRGFDRNVLPSLRGNAVATNASGSSAQGVAEGLAASDMNRQMSDTISDLMARTYEADASRQLQALMGTPQMVNTQANVQQAPGALTSTWGGQNQALQQGRLAGEMDRWNYYRDAPMNRLMGYGQMLGGIPGAQGQSSTTTTQNPSSNYNTWMGALGGLSMGMPNIFNAFQNQQNAGNWSGQVMNNVAQNPASFGTASAFF
jgi:hypothetical protein